MFHYQEIIDLQIEYKKRRPSQVWSGHNSQIIAFTVDGYLIRNILIQKLYFQLQIAQIYLIKTVDCKKYFQVFNWVKILLKPQQPCVFKEEREVWSVWKWFKYFSRRKYFLFSTNLWWISSKVKIARLETSMERKHPHGAWLGVCSNSRCAGFHNRGHSE